MRFWQTQPFRRAGDWHWLECSEQRDPDADLPNLRGAAIRHDDKQLFPVDKIMVIRTAQGPGLYLLFSRTNTITTSTKEVTIEFTIGRVTTKAKFKVKDMEYRGKLEL